MKILNYGSLNLDYAYHLDHFVRAGETEASFARTMACGGKGLNQSIALARAGASVMHAGAVGKMDGEVLIQALEEAGVDTSLVRRLEDVPSGSAFIQVIPNGENAIILNGGANHAVTEEDIDRVLAGFGKDDWLLIQNEISSLPYLMEKAHEAGMKIILNPSPMNESIWKMPLEYVDLFLVNEQEASMLSHHAEDPIREFTRSYPSAAFVITRGSKGCTYLHGEETVSQDAFHVTAVDTTGAGDTFTGFFLGTLAEGGSVQEALRIASAAAAVSVTRPGAGSSIPEKEEVLAFLNADQAK